MVNEYHNTINSKELSAGEADEFLTDRRFLGLCCQTIPPDLADVRTEIQRGLLHVISHRAAFLLPLPCTKNARVTNIFYLAASLNNRAGMCVPAVLGVEAVSGLQRASGCYIHASQQLKQRFT